MRGSVKVIRRLYASQYPGLSHLARWKKLRNLLPLIVSAIALTIFFIDTVTALEIAVAVFHVLVILLALIIWQRRGVWTAGCGCLLLTILSYPLSDSGAAEAGRVNLLISLSAIAATMWLALRLTAAQSALDASRSLIAHRTRVAALGELSASLAHELKQPLAAVVTSGEAGRRWLTADAPAPERALAALDRVVADAHRASTIIDRLRTLVSPEPSHRRVCTVQELLSDSLSLVQAECQRQHVTVSTRCPPDLPPVHVDPIQLQQVLLNLLMNALEAQTEKPGGGRWITIAARPVDAEIELSVCDGGRGLPTGDAIDLFEPFHSTKAGGLGMGLAIARSIVESHGGRVWAHNAPPGGACLHLRLPTCSPASIAQR